MRSACWILASRPAAGPLRSFWRTAAKEMLHADNTGPRHACIIWHTLSLQTRCHEPTVLLSQGISIVMVHATASSSWHKPQQLIGCAAGLTNTRRACWAAGPRTRSRAARTATAASEVPAVQLHQATGAGVQQPEAAAAPRTARQPRTKASTAARPAATTARHAALSAWQHAPCSGVCAVHCSALHMLDSLPWLMAVKPPRSYGCSWRASLWSLDSCDVMQAQGPAEPHAPGCRRHGPHIWGAWAWSCSP